MFPIFYAIVTVLISDILIMHILIQIVVAFAHCSHTKVLPIMIGTIASAPFCVLKKTLRRHVPFKRDEVFKSLFEAVFVC